MSKTEPENKIIHNPIKTVTHSAFVSEFKEFINRGNVIDLAIGVAIGGAFTAIVKSLVDDIIMPVSSLLAGGLDFSTLAIDIPNIFGADSTAHIAYGNFLQNVVNFLLVALVIFIIIRIMNKLNRKKDQDAKDEKEAQDKADAAKKAQKIKDNAKDRANKKAATEKSTK